MIHDSFEVLLFHPVLQKISWGLLHSLWEIAILAVIYGLGSLLISSRLIRIRYLFGCAILLCMLLLPITTMFMIEPVSFPGTAKSVEFNNTVFMEYPSPFTVDPVPEEDEISAFLPESELEPQFEADSGIPDSFGDFEEIPSLQFFSDDFSQLDFSQDDLSSEQIADWESPILTELDSPDFDFEENANHDPEPPPFHGFAGEKNSTLRSQFAEFGLESVRYFPLFAIFWMLGVAFFTLKLLRSMFRLRILRKNTVPLLVDPWEDLLNSLRKRMNIRTRVLLRASGSVDSPILLGFWRPMILVPLSMISGLSPEWVEAVLAHELAHVKRCDYLVNLGQVVIETLLFYHPLLWWVSRCVRRDREYLCDEIAIDRGSLDTLTYIQTLTRLEQLRQQEAPNMKGLYIVPAAAAKPLLNRIKRIMKMKPNSTDRRSDCLAGALIVLFLLAFPVAMLYLNSGAVPRKLQAATTIPGNAIAKQNPEDSLEILPDTEIGVLTFSEGFLQVNDAVFQNSPHSPDHAEEGNSEQEDPMFTCFRKALSKIPNHSPMEGFDALDGDARRASVLERYEKSVEDFPSVSMIQYLHGANSFTTVQRFPLPSEERMEEELLKKLCAMLQSYYLEFAGEHAPRVFYNWENRSIFIVSNTDQVDSLFPRRHPGFGDHSTQLSETRSLEKFLSVYIKELCDERENRIRTVKYSVADLLGKGKDREQRMEKLIPLIFPQIPRIEKNVPMEAVSFTPHWETSSLIVRANQSQHKEIAAALSALRFFTGNHENEEKSIPYFIEPSDHLRITVFGTPLSKNEPTALHGNYPVLQGEYLIGPDGYIAFDENRRIYVQGLTLQECGKQIGFSFLPDYENLRVQVEIVRTNSKEYHIIANYGEADIVYTYNLRGGETVLSAAASFIDQTRKPEEIWIARPTPNSHEPVILKVDWDAITEKMRDETNHSVRSGDRIFIRWNPGEEPEFSVPQIPLKASSKVESTNRPEVQKQSGEKSPQKKHIEQRILLEAELERKKAKTEALEHLHRNQEISLEEKFSVQPEEKSPEEIQREKRAYAAEIKLLETVIKRSRRNQGKPLEVEIIRNLPQEKVEHYIRALQESEMYDSKEMQRLDRILRSAAEKVEHYIRALRDSGAFSPAEIQHTERVLLSSATKFPSGESSSPHTVVGLKDIPGLVQIPIPLADEEAKDLVRLLNHRLAEQRLVQLKIQDQISKARPFREENVADIEIHFAVEKALAEDARYQELLELIELNEGHLKKMIQSKWNQREEGRDRSRVSRGQQSSLSLDSHISPLKEALTALKNTGETLREQKKREILEQMKWEAEGGSEAHRKIWINRLEFHLANLQEPSDSIR